MVGTILGLIALAPLIPILEAARAVAIAGYSAADVGSAVAADRLASDGYTQHVEEQFRQSAKAVNSRFGRFLIGGIGVAQLVASMDMLVGVRNVPVWWKILIEVAIAAVMLWMGVELVGHALQLGPFKTRVTRYVETARSRGIRLTDALWTSLPVRALLGIGRLFAWKKKRVPTVASTRPTESILAGAAADVFAGLPAGDRAALSAVPEVVRRLEALATQLRTRKAALDQAIGAVGDLGGGARRAKVAGDMVAEREVVSERLRATVEGLENLRLDLLRLRAGVGSPVDLTEAIEAARQIGLDVTFTLEGRSEAERVV
jgi:hypothetical protein